MTSFEEKQIIANAINKGDDYLLSLCTEQFSAHVIDKIACFDDSLIVFLYEFVLKHFHLLASNQSSICIIKNIIKHVKNEKLRKELGMILVNNFSQFINHPFANYSIQTALEHWDMFHLFPLFNLFIGNFINLSLLKYSSNVVETCLIVGGEKIVSAYVQQIITFNCSSILIKSNYGNYVIQKVLKLAPKNLQAAVIKNILQSIDCITDLRLVFKWKQICNKYFEEIFKKENKEQRKRYAL